MFFKSPGGGAVAQRMSLGLTPPPAACRGCRPRSCSRDRGVKKGRNGERGTSLPGVVGLRRPGRLEVVEAVGLDNEALEREGNTS